MSRIPVKRTKNQTNTDQSILAGASVGIVIALGVKPTGDVKVTGNEVTAGSIIKQVSCYVNVTPPTAAVDSLQYYIAMQRNGQDFINQLQPDFTSIGLSANRNQVIWSDMDQTGSGEGPTVRKKFRLKIPKIYQRLREGDALLFVIKSAQGSETSIGFRYQWYN